MSRNLLLPAAVLGLSFLALPVVADDARDCQKAEGKARLDACQRAIASKRWEGRELAWAYVNIGHYYDEAGDPDRSLEAFSEAIKLFPTEGRTFNNRGNIHLKKNDADRAIKDFDEAIRLNQKNYFAWGNRGRAYLYKNDLKHALADLNEAIRLDPGLARSYLYRGEVYFKMIDRDRAVGDYNKAIELEKDSFFALERVAWQAYNNRAMVFLSKGDFVGALEDFNEAIRLNPKSALARANRGWLYERKGDLDLALAEYEEALKLNPELQQARRARERVRQKKK
jgi:tetratricopeptide (TPR) repeat protein